MAKIVYRIVCGEGNHTPQFDEQLRLINAYTEEEAFTKAKSMAEHDQSSFLNQKKELVQWQFINIPELYKLSSLTDGVEIYSKIQEEEHAGVFIETINKKASHLRTSFSENVSEYL